MKQASSFLLLSTLFPRVSGGSYVKDMFSPEIKTPSLIIKIC